MRVLACALVMGLGMASVASAQVRSWPVAEPFSVLQGEDYCGAWLDVYGIMQPSFVLMVRYDGERVQIALVSEEWTFDEGEEFDGLFDFPGTDYGHAARVRTASLPNGHGYTADLDPVILEDFAAADRIELQRDGRRLAWAGLRGSGRAVKALRDCVADLDRKRGRAGAADAAD